MASRDEIVSALDEYLDIDGMHDSSLNGLQIEGAAEIERVALAVDAAQATIDAAVAADCRMLIVHHGLFWGSQVALRGVMGRRVRAAFAGDLSLYAAHLPLDAHDEVGNNVLLAQALGGAVDGKFGEYEGAPIGVLARLAEPLDIGGLAGRLAAAGCEEPLIWSFGDGEVSRIALVTGRGGFALAEAAAAGADCFITGEPIQELYHAARDHGIHCLFGGHYATETFGVRAVGAWLAGKFGVETVWIDHPTGI
jgi:dinuclear metal center YbgI/SA1388 family protein